MEGFEGKKRKICWRVEPSSPLCSDIVLFVDIFVCVWIIDLFIGDPRQK